jgi:hypothetical protein
MSVRTATGHGQLNRAAEQLDRLGIGAVVLVVIAAWIFGDPRIEALSVPQPYRWRSARHTHTPVRVDLQIIVVHRYELQ